MAWEARTSPLSLIFSSSWVFVRYDRGIGEEEEEDEEEGLTLYGAYHFARRVLPLVEVSPYNIATKALGIER